MPPWVNSNQYSNGIRRAGPVSSVVESVAHKLNTHARLSMCLFWIAIMTTVKVGFLWTSHKTPVKITLNRQPLKAPHMTHEPHIFILHVAKNQRKGLPRVYTTTLRPCVVYKGPIKFRPTTRNIHHSMLLSCASLRHAFMVSNVGERAAATTHQQAHRKRAQCTRSAHSTRFDDAQAHTHTVNVQQLTCGDARDVGAYNVRVLSARRSAHTRKTIAG